VKNYFSENVLNAFNLSAFSDGNLYYLALFHAYQEKKLDFHEI
jgi:hypothetical protein